MPGSEIAGSYNKYMFLRNSLFLPVWEPQGITRGAYHSVQFSSFAQLCPTLCNPNSTPGLPVRHQLPELAQIHVHWVSDTIQPSHPLSSPSVCPQSFPASGSFLMGHLSHQVAKILEFQLKHQSFQWTPGLISFTMDWLGLPGAQGTLKSLLQHHSSKSSLLQYSAFFTVQL